MKERKQFGAPLAAFQLTQQKLVQMLGNIQAMILVGWRLCKLYDSGKMTPGRVSLGKVFWLLLFCSHRTAIEVMHSTDDNILCFPGMDYLKSKGDYIAWAGVTWWQWNLDRLSSCKGFNHIFIQTFPSYST